MRRHLRDQIMLVVLSVLSYCDMYDLRLYCGTLCDICDTLSYMVICATAPAPQRGSTRSANAAKSPPPKSRKARQADSREPSACDFHEHAASAPKRGKYRRKPSRQICENDQKYAGLEVARLGLLEDSGMATSVSHTQGLVAFTMSGCDG